MDISGRFMVFVFITIPGSLAQKTPCSEIQQGLVQCQTCHRQNWDCSPDSLSKEFSELYSQSWISAGPDAINVTTFCKKDEMGEERPGLNIEWTPPRHNGAHNIEGFEVMIEGSPGADIQCRIILLQTHIEETDVDQVFREEIFPVSQWKPMVVTVHSLPKSKTESQYSKESIVTLRTCSKKVNAAANWSPDVINLDYRGRQLQVDFQPPPPAYGFKSFEILLVNNSDLTFLKTSTQSSGHTFTDVSPGRYYLEITPYDPFWGDSKKCLCRNLNSGICLGCQSTQTQAFNLTDKTTDLTLAPESRDGIEEEPSANTLLIVSVASLVLLIGITILLIFGRRRRKDKRHRSSSQGLEHVLKTPDYSLIVLTSTSDTNTLILVGKLSRLLETAFDDNQNVKIVQQTYEDRLEADFARHACIVLVQKHLNTTTNIEGRLLPPNIFSLEPALSSKISQTCIRVLVKFDGSLTKCISTRDDECAFTIPSQLLEMVAFLYDSMGIKSQDNLEANDFVQKLQCRPLFLTIQEDLMESVHKGRQGYRSSKDTSGSADCIFKRERSNSNSSPDSGFTMDKISDDCMCKAYSLSRDYISPCTSAHLENFGKEGQTCACSVHVFTPDVCPDDISFIAPSEMPESEQEYPETCGTSAMRTLDHFPASCKHSIADSYVYQQMREINRRYNYIVHNQTSTGEVSSVFYADA